MLDLDQVANWLNIYFFLIHSLPAMENESLKNRYSIKINFIINNNKLSLCLAKMLLNIFVTSPYNIDKLYNVE